MGLLKNQGQEALYQQGRRLRTKKLRAADRRVYSARRAAAGLPDKKPPKRRRQGQVGIRWDSW